MNVKDVFDQAENGTLTWEQFQEATKGAKFVDLKEGGYVSKQKYDDDIQALNGTISTRDTDLAQLRQDLEKAGTDATKLSELTSNLESLQGKYDTDTKNFKEQLKKQAYEFAVKEFANSKKFTSKAAKRDFINSMMSKNLKMEGDSIIGAEDFVTAYSKDNDDAFFKDVPEEPEKPTFVAPTASPTLDADTNEGLFSNAFHFTEVHPKNNY